MIRGVISLSVKFWSFAAIVALAAYLIGSVSFAVIVSRVGAQDDVRRHGSGNAGMTNILRNYGKKMAAFTALGDFGKGIVAVAVGRMIFTLAGITVLDGGYIAGFFVVLGHLFPLYFGFKGGKGVLVGAVMLAFFDWRVFAIAFALFILSVVLTKWISLGSILGAVSFPITTWLFYRDPVLTAMAFGMAAAVVFMHRSNIGRILHGTENKFSFKSKKTIEASPDGEEK